MATKQIHNYTAANAIDASADLLLIDPASSGIYKSINRNTLLGLASAPLGTTDTQSPTNKTFDNTNSITVKDGSLTIQNSAGTTKQAVFSAASITAGQTRTFTFPDASGTLVTTAGTQTLTNKTITSPTITGGTIDNSTITVDSISGHTLATTVTVANLQIANGVLNTANSVTATAIAAGAVQPQALVAGTGSGWAFTSFTPAWTNLTVGNGTNTGYFIQVGKMVFGYVALILGTTSAVGSTPYFTAPVTNVSSHYNTSSVFYSLGSFAAAAGATAFLGYFNYGANGANHIYMYNSSGATITATTPGTWGNGNYLCGHFMYEAA